MYCIAAKCTHQIPYNMMYTAAVELIFAHHRDYFYKKKEINTYDLNCAVHTAVL